MLKALLLAAAFLASGMAYTLQVHNSGRHCNCNCNCNWPVAKNPKEISKTSAILSSNLFKIQASIYNAIHLNGAAFYSCKATSGDSFAENTNNDNNNRNWVHRVRIKCVAFMQVLVTLVRSVALVPLKTIANIIPALRNRDNNSTTTTTTEIQNDKVMDRTFSDFGTMKVNGDPNPANSLPPPPLKEATPPDEVAFVKKKVRAQVQQAPEQTINLYSNSTTDASGQLITAPLARSKVASPVITSSYPLGDRWAVGAVDLSGEWKLIVSEDFKKEYDEYLKQLGQPVLVRSIALGIIGLTNEMTNQTDEGRVLFIRGENARGVWERSLVASGSDGTASDYTPLTTDVVTADSESVKAEAWWEEKGTIHKSWLRGVTKYGGGDFESCRYLENDKKVLVCESTFHPKESGREKARVTWKFLRNGETLT